MSVFVLLSGIFLGPIGPLELGVVCWLVGWLVFIENLHWELGNWGLGSREYEILSFHLG